MKMQSWQVRIFTAIAACVCVAAISSRADERKALSVPTLDSAPLIDGKLDDAAWAGASEVSGFRKSSGGEPMAETLVRVGRSATHLYVAFRCEEPNPESIRATARHYREIWQNNNDVVALFFRPDMEGHIYYQFACTPAGVVQTQERDMREKGAVNRELPVAIRTGREPGAWVVELGLPLHVVGLSEQMGRTWGLNFCRYRSQDKSLSDFCGVGSSWHRPELFAHVPDMIVGGNIPGDADVTLGPVRLPQAKPQANIPFSVEVRGRGRDGVEVAATVFTRAPSGRVSSFDVEPTVVPPQGKRTLGTDVWLPAEAGDHLLWFVLTDASTGEEILTSPRSALPMESVIGALTARHYYTSEDAARVMLRLPEFGTHVLLEVRAGDRVVKTVKAAAAAGKSVVPVGIGDLEPGTYDLAVVLLDAENKPLSRARTPLVKRAPADAGSEIKVDRERNILLANGDPVFPHGFCMNNKDFVDLEVLKEAGFNTLFIGWGGAGSFVQAGEDALHAYLERASEMGLWVYGLVTVMGPRCSYSSPDLREVLRSSTETHWRDMIKGVRHFRNILAWHTFDEPNLAGNHTVDGRGVTDELRACYDMIHDVSPYTPVVVNYCRSITDTPEDAACWDIGMSDPYWNPLRAGHKIGLVVDYVKDGARVTGKYGKLYNVILNSEMVSSSARPMTPPEQRLQTYVALIHGARGIFYFTYPVRSRAMWEEFSKLAKEVRAMTPALVEQQPDVRVIADQREARYLAVSLREGNGRAWLITANLSDEAALRASFEIKGLPESCPVTVVFEDRDLAVAKGVLSDEFGPYQTHVYQFALPEQREGRPIVVSVRADVATVQRSRTRDFARIDPDKNLIVCPGIECGPGTAWSYKCWGDADAHLLQKGWRDTEVAHSGEASLHLRRGNTQAANHFFGRPIKLKPGTRYRFGGFLKSKVETGAHGPRLWIRCHDPEAPKQRSVVPGSTIKTMGQTMVNILGQSDWREHFTIFDTGAHSEEARFQVYCSFYASIGDAWFDDLYLVEEGVAVARQNLLMNSSFERDDCPGYPNWITNYSYMFAGRRPKIGDPDCAFFLDPNVAHHGQKSLRFRVEGGTAGRKPRIDFTGVSRMDLGEETEYTFSAWVKADSPGVKARLMVRDPVWRKGASASKTFSVGVEWTRIHMLYKTLPRQTGAFVRIDQMGPGTLWMDALQFERGTDPSPYRPREE